MCLLNPREQLRKTNPTHDKREGAQKKKEQENGQDNQSKEINRQER
jgi:hypothetical protein